MPNTIVNSFNRNFPKRNDGSANTLSFVTSPDTVIALALAGRLDFDPTTDTITNADGAEVLLEPPVGEVLPRRATTRARTRSPPPRPTARASRSWCRRPATGCSCCNRSRRGTATTTYDLPVLMKAQGKCTTDHISAAGKWLKYRGHLENISGNLFIGVVSAFDRRGRRGRRLPRRQTRHIAEPRQEVRRGRDPLGGDRRPQLRRGLEPRARGDGAPLPRRRGDHRPQLRPHPRDQPEEAGPRAADVRRPGHLRPDRARTIASTCSACRRCPARTSAARSSSPTAPIDRLRRRAHLQRRAGRVVQGRLGTQRRAPEGGRRPVNPDLVRRIRQVSRSRSGRPGNQMLPRPMHGSRRCQSVPGRRVRSSVRPTAGALPGGYVRASSSAVGVRWRRRPPGGRRSMIAT